MKIKSLLLGSAAVMVAVPAARAADAIIIEPEPVEYVRVCDAYGAGWWYIPGTETCLRISGLVYAYYGVDVHGDDDGDTSDHQAGFRGRLNVQANNETEYGTLASYIRLQGNGQERAGGSILDGIHTDEVSDGYFGDSPAVLDKAYMSLAGFTVGYLDNWWSRGLRYGYYNVDFFDYANYKYQDALAIDYTYAANGWTFSVGAESAARSGLAGAPDVYAGITYSGGGLFLGGVYYNDSSAGSGAWRVRADYDFGNGFQIGGWYAADDGDTDFVKGHQWGATAAMNLTDSLVLWGGYNSYADTYHDNGPCQAFNTTIAATPQNDCFNTGSDSWTVGLDWQIVNGLLLQLTYSSIVFDDNNGTYFSFTNTTTATPDTFSQPNQGVVGIQLTRSF